METSHENSRFRSQLLEKTIVLNPSLLARLKSQFLPSATATVATFATIKNLRKLEIQKELLQKTTVLSINKLTKVNLKKSFQKLGVISFTSLLAGCTSPSYANNVKVQQRVNTNNSKVYVRVNSNCKDSSQLEKINQLSFFDSFNCIDAVAVNGNNVKQEPRKLPVSVSHHTLVDVFLCLSFANCLFTGELRLALALVRLWWGGHGNKPFIGRIPCAVLQRFSSLPTALYLGLIIKTSLPLEKVL